MNIFDLPSIEVSAAELPESIIARFPERPAADARLIIMLESHEDEEEKFRLLKVAIDEGMADIEAGRVSSGEEVFARLEKKFPPV